MTWQRICKLFNLTFGEFSAIIKQLGLPGRMTNGTRLWSDDDVQAVQINVCSTRATKS